MITVLTVSIIVFSLCVLLLELMVRISTSPDLNPLNGLSSLKTNMMTSKIWSHVKTENYECVLLGLPKPTDTKNIYVVYGHVRLINPTVTVFGAYPPNLWPFSILVNEKGDITQESKELELLNKTINKYKTQ
jgi:hypothetical protein